MVMLHWAAGNTHVQLPRLGDLAARVEETCKVQACCVILPSLCCREKVPAAGQALQEQMHKGITELKRLAGEPLGPEVTKKTEAAISYVDTTYQKLISTPAGGLCCQQAMLSWLDSRVLSQVCHVAASCSKCAVALRPVWVQHPGFAALTDACFGLLQQVGCSGLPLSGAGLFTDWQHPPGLFGGMLCALLGFIQQWCPVAEPWCPPVHANWRAAPL